MLFFDWLYFDARQQDYPEKQNVFHVINCTCALQSGRIQDNSNQGQGRKKQPVRMDSVKSDRANLNARQIRTLPLLMRQDWNSVKTH